MQHNMKDCRCFKYGKSMNTVGLAIYNGHIDCLKYAVESRYPLSDMAYDSDTLTAEAAKQGNFEIFKYTWDHCGGKNNDDIIWNAMIHGNYDILIFANENGCPWYTDGCKCSWMHENLSCVRYCIECSKDCSGLPTRVAYLLRCEGLSYLHPGYKCRFDRKTQITLEWKFILGNGKLAATLRIQGRAKKLILTKSLY